MLCKAKMFLAVTCVVALSLGGGVRSARAATISGDTVDFIDVTQTSSTDVPGNLFGSFAVVGDKLDFNPIDGPGFGANSGDGTTDTTDGSLSFTVMTNQVGATITALVFGEGGDYTVKGFGADNLGTTGTNVSVVTLIKIDILEGAPVGSFEFPMALAFSPSDGTINLVDDTPPSSGFWTGDGVIDVSSFAMGATKLQVTLNNQLSASSEVITYETLIGTNPDVFGTVTGTTSAIIVKKDFMVTVETRVPEPATFVFWVLGGIFGVVAARTRRKRSFCPIG